MIPESQEPDQMTCNDYLSLLPETASWLQCKKEKIWAVRKLQSGGGKTESPGRPEQLKFSGQGTKQKTASYRKLQMSAEGLIGVVNRVLISTVREGLPKTRE